MKLAHVINPVKVPVGTELHTVQPVTFKSIQVAKAFAPQVNVDLYAVSYVEDAEIIPADFKQLPHLNRSVADKFTGKKKLPYIADILNALYKNTDAEYLIYTNMDIALMPQFYTVVEGLLLQGHDAVMINRRGIPAKYTKPEELPQMYSEHGKPHPGFDCFVFKRSLLPKMVLAEVCIGVPFLEVTLLHNLIAFADNLKLVDDMHLTFHIGTEVMPPIDKQLYTYNRSQYEQQVYPAIKLYFDIRKFPYSELPFLKRVLKWALNPCFRTHQVLEMEGKSFSRRMKYKFDTWRFALLQKVK
jgi:hypothetical protein